MSRPTRCAALLACAAAFGCGAGGPATPESDSAEPDSPFPRAASYPIVFAAELADEASGQAGWALFGLDLSTGDTAQLTRPRDYTGYPVWSPGGEHVLFLADGADFADLLALDAVTGDVSVLVEGMADPVDFSPDGDSILLTGSLPQGRGLFIQRLATGDEEVIDTGSSADAYARWSPAGGSVTFESGRDGNPEIYRHDFDTGDNTRLTDDPDLDEWPSFSPDGLWIAWASGSEEEKDLWVMRADGGQARQLTRGLMFGDAYPEWSPDGARILLTVAEGDGFVLKLVEVETGAVADVTAGAAATWR